VCSLRLRAKGGCTACFRTDSRSCQSAPTPADLSGARDSDRFPESDRKESALLLAFALLNSPSNPGTSESMTLLALLTTYNRSRKGVLDSAMWQGAIGPFDCDEVHNHRKSDDEFAVSGDTDRQVRPVRGCGPAWPFPPRPLLAILSERASSRARTA